MTMEVVLLSAFSPIAGRMTAVSRPSSSTIRIEAAMTDQNELRLIRPRKENAGTVPVSSDMGLLGLGGPFDQNAAQPPVCHSNAGTSGRLGVASSHASA